MTRPVLVDPLHIPSAHTLFDSFRSFFFFFVGMFKEGGSRVSRKGSCAVIIANNEPRPRRIMTIHVRSDEVTMADIP